MNIRNKNCSTWDTFRTKNFNGKFAKHIETFVHEDVPANCLVSCSDGLHKILKLKPAPQRSIDCYLSYSMTSTLLKLIALSQTQFWFYVSYTQRFLLIIPSVHITVFAYSTNSVIHLPFISVDIAFGLKRGWLPQDTF